MAGLKIDMRGPYISPTIAGLMLSVLLGCDLNSIPLGRSRLSAKVDGMFVEFKDIRSSLYINLVTTGRSDSGSVLSLVFNDLSVGTHRWFNAPPTHLSPDQAAHLDGWRAWPGLGSYVIDQHHDGNRHLVGSFTFCLVDTAAHDTTFVTDGRFDLYYGLSD
jgi:hypothetical protein